MRPPRHQSRQPLEAAASLALALAVASPSPRAQEASPGHPLPSERAALDAALDATGPGATPWTNRATGAHRDGPARPQQRLVRLRTAALLAATLGSTLAYGRAKWWQDGFSGGFKMANEGWFGQNTAYGGADKLGHAMFAYTGTRLLAQLFEAAGNEPGRALQLGLWTSVGTLMGVELIDGFSRQWRFSREDALSNLAGGALGYLLETHPALDALLDLRLQYSPSTRPGGRREFDPFGDYSGQRYLVVLKASGMPALRGHPLLRYLEFNIGYGTRNFDPATRALVAPARHVYAGLALNLTELLRDTAFRDNPAPSRTQHLTETFLEFVQIPVLTVQGDHVIR